MIKVRHERIGTIILKLLERQHPTYPDTLGSDFVMVCSDDRTPNLAAISRLSYDEGQARRAFERAIEIAKHEAA